MLENITWDPCHHILGPTGQWQEVLGGEGNV